jgi:hypothetical protein
MPPPPRGGVRNAHFFPQSSVSNAENALAIRERAGEIQRPALGMVVEVLDEQGRPSDRQLLPGLRSIAGPSARRLIMP